MLKRREMMLKRRDVMLKRRENSHLSLIRLRVRSSLLRSLLSVFKGRWILMRRDVLHRHLSLTSSSPNATSTPH